MFLLKWPPRKWLSAFYELTNFATLLNTCCYSNATPKQISDLIVHLKEVLIEMLHTKEGSRVAIRVIGYGNASDRKAIIKSFKGYVDRVAKVGGPKFQFCKSHKLFNPICKLLFQNCYFRIVILELLFHFLLQFLFYFASIFVLFCFNFFF